MHKGSSWDEGFGHSWTLSLPLLSVSAFSVCLCVSPDITRQLSPCGHTGGHLAPSG